MALWRGKLFVLMLRNAALAPDFFRITADDVIELHMKLEI
jgi:K+ transporter